MRARLFAAVLLLPLVALATATGGVGLRCRITGEVLSACCCDNDDVSKAPSVTTVSEADCCDRIVRDVTIAPAELGPAPSALPDQTTPLARVTFVVPAIDLLPSARARRPETPASLGPRTVRLRLVSKSSFLI